MLMGPVFRSELLRTARRPRYYTLRLVYGAILLLLVWSGYQQSFGGSRTASIARVAMFAADTFFIFAIVQLVTAFVLIPPLFAGTIADEKQRKTLHYLMASRLSGGEIVVDKLLGRLPILAVFLAMGLPVVSILGLFGGVPADFVAVAYIGTLTSCAFAASIAVVVSTLARGVRQAVLTAYVFVAAWVFIPTIVDLVASRLPGLPYHLIQPANEWLVQSSPFGALLTVLMRARPRSLVSTSTPEFQWMVGIQLGGAALLLLLAVWRLRPTFRRQEETPARRSWFVGRNIGQKRGRWFVRPECGNDAVLWKERYFAPTDRFTRLVVLPAIVVVTLPLALLTEVQGDLFRVISDVCLSGLSASPTARENLVWALRVDLGWYTALWLLSAAGAAASSVTIELEKDTWVSLTSTPLSGWSILRAKALGAIWNQRGFAAVLAFVWLLALATGAVRPIGVLASVLLVGILTWLVVALGMHASLRATSTSRALVTTIVSLCLLNGYPLILILWFGGLLDWDSSFTLLGFMPRLAVAPLVSPQFALDPWWGAAKPLGSYFNPLDFAPIGRLLLLGFYVATATVLTWRVVFRFDDWLDRPGLTTTNQQGVVPFHRDSSIAVVSTSA
jgi:ABC-type transport system involved in multi-copper enzyme maturation permease subunit